MRGATKIVSDIFGIAWRVVEARPTSYGFDVFLGRPAIKGLRAAVLTNLWGRVSPD